VLWFLAILSYNQTDNSFNSIGYGDGSDVKNFLSIPGAYVADLSIQLFGYGSAILSLIFIIFFSFNVFLKRYYSFYIMLINSTVFVIICTYFIDKISLIEQKGLKTGGYFAYIVQSKFENYIFPILILFILNIILTYLYKVSTINKIIAKIFKKILNNQSVKNHKIIYITDEYKDEYKSDKSDLYKITTITNIEDHIDHEAPKIDFLEQMKKTSNISQIPINSLSFEEKARLLEQTLRDFGINGEIINISPGPVVTLYEFEPAAGIKSSRIIGLADDISRSMCATSTRIAVISGHNAIGIELPNQTRETVLLRELIESNEYNNSTMKLPLALGKSINGKVVMADLTKMPHLLVAGTTGSGKSVAINAMIISLLYSENSPNCKFIMIDPKMLELSVYEGIPNLLTPVVTDPKKAISAFKWVVREMENRYHLMSSLGVRNIDNFNSKIKEAIRDNQKLERVVQTGFDAQTRKPVFEKVNIELKTMPLIVVIVDEMADLMLVAGKEIEISVQRLAQMARAAGIHLIMATQRPSVDVITGVIKANLPTRISFAVTSKIDSRTILGESGAEQLLGRGDMLYTAGGSKLIRIHGPFVSDQEVQRIVEYLKKDNKPNYNFDVVSEVNGNIENNIDNNFENNDDDNDLYKKAVDIVLRNKKPTVSYIQRQLRIGYNRAADLIEKMERDEIVSQPSHNGKREILIDD
jgi:S-DNA-T family DNA segregation ATPase FtsK/SpoIIIE